MFELFLRWKEGAYSFASHAAGVRFVSLAIKICIFLSGLVLVCSSHSSVSWSLAIASQLYTRTTYKYRKLLFSSLPARALCCAPALLPTITWRCQRLVLVL